MQLKAVLFDLDDTLFDHKHCRLQGLMALQRKYEELRPLPLEQLEREHDELLKADYGKVLDGTISLVEGTALRIRRLCFDHGIHLDDSDAMEAVDLYSASYRDNRQAVPGAKELLTSLSSRFGLGVVTNGLVDSQMDKLKICGLEQLLDTVIISEAVGHRKPDSKIFLIALRELGTGPSGAVYIGDSWETDILPASRLGMRTYWLNRYSHLCPDPSIAKEIAGFRGIDYRYFMSTDL